MDTKWTSMKVQKTTVDAAKELVEYVIAHGWRSLGAERTDPPSIGAVVDEALTLLAARMRRKEKKK
jgi:hypothetical protein